MMKAYKIDLSMLDSETREDVSATIQRHAFRLGYAWQYGGKKTQYEDCPVLCFEADGRILKDEDTDRFNKLTNTEISITDFLALKPEDVKDAPEFKPFDKVLVRDGIDETWTPAFFSRTDKSGAHVIIGMGAGYRYCIPYKGNEHLRGTKEASK